MGGAQTKNKNKSSSSSPSLIEQGLRSKLNLLEREIREIMIMRETETLAFDQDTMIFSFKETEWREERNKLKQEIKKLRMTSSSLIMEDKEVEEERQRTCRDEAVERWKKLYLAIKVELDDLILKTHQENMYWRSGENEELKRILREREETIEILQTRLASMEQEEMRKEREMDILRQSLRIMCYNNNNNMMMKKKKNKYQPRSNLLN
ncbi:golgin subfamily A member 6-like protein 4 isoform X2 [Impatiens glandulifera]|uniref:golgin subfamily A member 6-like protein 4 isoform X2 n=1 Tax=Impatiens glandulifera TaxID=253017 RepID=UPI001FB14A1D|nr:golgin subfamily A member 6-like protein 4 isoform X2 [Impatiens glandulifera]